MDATDGLTLDVLERQLGETYTSYGSNARLRHVALLDQIRQPGDVAVSASPAGDERWIVTVCTSDRVGILSLIAGLFTSFRCDILSADIFTVRVPRASSEPPMLRRRRLLRTQQPGPSRRLLDVFEVRTAAGAAESDWQRFRDDLAHLVGLVVADHWDTARDAIVDRIADVFRDTTDPASTMLPVSVDVTTDSGTGLSRVTVHSADIPGFLFAFTNALAGFTINIERATIRNAGGEAVDTFWVTDVAGKPIVDAARIHELRVATALIKQFTYLLPRSPNPGQALRQFDALIRQMLAQPNWTTELSNFDSADVLETLAGLMGVSRFLWEDFLRIQHENLFPVLLDIPSLQEPKSKDHLLPELDARTAAASGHTAQVAALNAFKDREMFRIDLRHITGRSDFHGFSSELSALAEVVIATAASLTETDLHGQFGRPTLPNGQICPWMIAALGKFGGGELGFGSDLELLIVYEGEGTTTGPQTIVNSQYFGLFVQGLRSAITSRQEGIFEIDLRLRPFGKAGAMASTVAGFQQYYSPEGAAEQFERLALVRLRPVAGDAALGRRITALRDQYVYSGRPLSIANILHFRHRQATELAPSGTLNAKYSRGGLVDVEYYVQAWQIVVGHEDPAVRVPNTLAAIERLAAGGHLSGDLANELAETYSFLRRLIDALRVVRGNAKDLAIPHADSREFDYLAQRLRYQSTTALQQAITDRMAFARRLWEGPLPSGLRRL